MAGSKSSKLLRSFEFFAAILLLAVMSAAAVWWVHARSYTLYDGDAQAHLNIARRIVDSRTPGYYQIGTVWLPVPHLLMLPLVGDDELWRSGLAGAVPAGVCFVLAGAFLFAAARRVYVHRAAAAAVLTLFALNPNLLYLQAIPMNEAMFFAALSALLYFAVRFRDRPSAFSAAAGALATLAATLTRYEGWFLIPFATLYFLITAKRNRVQYAILFGAVAALGPLYWLGHNWWYYGDALEFYRGPYSAQAIYQRALDQGMARYPGDQEWTDAARYFAAAVGLCAGWPLVWLGLAGAAVAVWKRRAVWPLLLLALPPTFYVWSIHSGGTPIFVPHLWPNSYYNTRYGLAALPLLAFAVGALVAIMPLRLRPWSALAAIVLAVFPWLRSPQPDTWICWKESQVNSETRRAWTREAADFLRERYRPGSGIFTSFGDLTGIFQQAGIPLRETLHSGNVPHWDAAVARPDLFLWEEWAVAISGDRVATTLVRAGRRGPQYEPVKTIALKGAPVIRIYRRASRAAP